MESLPQFAKGLLVVKLLKSISFTAEEANLSDKTNHYQVFSTLDHSPL